MSALDLLSEARAAGVELFLADGQVRYRGPSEAVATLVPRLRQHKAEILAALAPTVTDAEVEREAGYNRVTCSRYANLTMTGVCRPKSTLDASYRPLEYVPVMLWRRCDLYRPGLAK